jgi:cytochrome d ubiquinol oxidase subunit I
VAKSTKLAKFAVLSLPMPFIAAAFGWIFTEIGRQPWIVYPVYPWQGGPSLATSVASSPSDVVAGWSVWITMVGLTLVYLVLAVFWFKLMRRYTAQGVDQAPIPSPSDDADDSKPLTFSY